MLYFYNLTQAFTAINLVSDKVGSIIKFGSSFTRLRATYESLATKGLDRNGTGTKNGKKNDY